MVYNYTWAIPVLFATTFILLLYKYVTRKYSYWIERNVIGPQPKPFVGNLGSVLTLKTSLPTLLRDFYRSYEDPVIGFFTFDEPALLIRDPKIVKDVLGKDFNYFQDRAMHQPKHNKVFGNIMFAMKNPEWKTTRAKLTPTFSSAKIKDMFQGIQDVCEELVKYIARNSGEQQAPQILKKYSTEVITRMFFGVNGHCFERKESDFLKYASAMFGFSFRNGLSQSMYFFKNNVVDILKLNFFPLEVQSFFKDVFWKCLKNVEGLKTKPHNFVAILEELRRNDPSFDDDLLESQGLMFFAAGTETISTSIVFLLYEFALNPDLQEKARKEIELVTQGKGLNYESLKEMKYLELCINESLRKHASIPFLDRKCSADYRIPGTHFIIEKNMIVFVPINALQNDEKYFPEPDKFIPERFLENVNATQCVYAPFGTGQRSCIGYRMGMLCTKIATAYILKNFSVEKTSKTPNVIDVDPRSLPLMAKGGMPLKFPPLKPHNE